MEALSCHVCQSPNAFIQYNNWVVCRECGQPSYFDWAAVPKDIKLPIFELMRDRMDLGASDQQVADEINRIKVASGLFHADESKLPPLPAGHEYARYFNLFIYLKYGTSGLPSTG